MPEGVFLYVLTEVVYLNFKKHTRPEQVQTGIFVQHSMALSKDSAQNNDAEYDQSKNKIEPSTFF